MASSRASVDEGLLTADAQPSANVAGRRWISGEPSNGGLDAPALDCIQNSIVHTLEVNFFFPFSLVDNSLTASSPNVQPMPSSRTRFSSSHRPTLTASMTASYFRGLTNQGERDQYALQFGDDGHLLFRECLKTIEVDEITTLRSEPVDETKMGYDDDVTWDTAENGLLKGRSSLASSAGAMTTETKGLPATLKDKRGNLYLLHKVFVRLFSFKVGILRFSITACQPINVQDLLDLQNSVMRLGSPKQAGRMTFADTDDPLVPVVFLSSILGKTLGAGKWVPDEHMDRMFTVTLAGISGLTGSDAVRHVAYAIANMEWSVDCSTGESYLEKFFEENVYKRHTTPDGGLWSCFHLEGGCSLFFTDKSDDLSSLLNPRNRKLGVKLLGSSRPLTTLSLAEAVIFQRMYLRNLDQKLDALILYEKHDAKSVRKLHVIHGDLLKFRSKFSYSPLSTTTAGKQQFQQWGQVVGLFDETAQLLETTKDLHSYNEDIINKDQQRRLDFLTVLLGFLGIAQLIMDIFLTWNNERTDKGDKRSSNIYVPISISALLLLACALFIRIQNKR